MQIRNLSTIHLLARIRTLPPTDTAPISERDQVRAMRMTSMHEAFLIQQALSSTSRPV